MCLQVLHIITKRHKLYHIHIVFFNKQLQYVYLLIVLLFFGVFFSTFL